MSWVPIIGKRFSPQEFEAYVSTLTWSHHFVPEFVVLHNTSVPSLKQRPQGFTAQHMKNLASYYQGKGWSSGPHLFVDDHGIWVFTPLTARGTHAPSWNGKSIGVEMLGEFQSEAFDSGRGALVRGNAVAAIAILSKRLRIDSHSMRLHKEDPKTTHKSCPGKHVDKAQFIQDVHDAILNL